MSGGSSVVEPEYDAVDIMILNILRCEPPSLRFNFFEYAGLPGSIFRLIADIKHNGFGSIDDVVAARDCKILNLPSSKDPHSNGHILTYRAKEKTSVITANAYNNFSGERDLKLLGRSKIKGTDGRDYLATFVALEVYRGKGNLRPVWEIGLYISPTKEITSEDGCLYEESFVCDVPRVVDRKTINGPLNAFLDQGLSELVYDPSLNGVTLHKPRYLSALVKRRGVDIVSSNTFEVNANKWLRYLLGTLDVKKVIKIEDKYARRDDPIKYRVELISTHLTQDSGEYLVERLEDEQASKDGPFNHREATEEFVRVGNSYLDTMYRSARKGERQFSVSLDWTRIDFEYATIVPDARGVPIVLTSWSSPFDVDGRKLDKTRHYYFQVWNGSPEPLRIELGNFAFRTDSENPGHPKNVMKRLIGAMPAIEYGDGSRLNDALVREGVIFEAVS
jgi:hypothetical protein